MLITYKKVKVSDLVRTVQHENEQAVWDNAVLYEEVSYKMQVLDPERVTNPDTVCRTGRRYRPDAVIYWKGKH